MRILACIIALGSFMLIAYVAGRAMPGTAIAVAGQTNHAGVELQLALSEGGDGVLATDTTNSEYIYNLSSDTAQSSVTGTFLICADDSFVGDPRWIELDDPTDNVRRAKPKRYAVRPIPPRDSVDEDDAIEYIAGLHATEAIQATAHDRTPDTGHPKAVALRRLVQQSTAVVRRFDAQISPDELERRVTRPAQQRFHALFERMEVPHRMRPKPLIEPDQLAEAIVRHLASNRSGPRIP